MDELTFFQAKKSKVDYMKDAILTMIQHLNERIEKWTDEDTEIIYDYDGPVSSRKNHPI